MMIMTGFSVCMKVQILTVTLILMMLLTVTGTVRQITWMLMMTETVLPLLMSRLTQIKTVSQPMPWTLTGTVRQII